MNRFFARLPVGRLKSLFDDFQLVRHILPENIVKSIWKVFALMICGSLFELASIFALTLFFRLIYSPAFIFDLPFISIALNKYPALETSLHDPVFVMQWACLLPIVMILLKNAIQAISAWKASSLAARTSAYVGSAIMEKFLRMSYGFHLSFKKGALLQAMQSRFDLGSMLMQILLAYSNLITVSFLFLGLFVYAPEISGITALFMFCAGMLTFIILRKGAGKAGEGMAAESSKANDLTQMILDGVREIAIHQKQSYFIKKINAAINAAARHFTFLSISPTIPTWILESAGFFMLWLTIYILAHYSESSHAEISSTIALLALTAWRVLPAMNRIVGAIVAVRGLRSNAINCVNFLEELEKVPGEPQIIPDSSFRMERRLELKNIHYSYPGASAEALSGVSCIIPAGSITGIVGKSGSGKSTLMDIICGLLQPSSGEILIDDAPVKTPEMAKFRLNIGYASQNASLFGESIENEVCFRDWGMEKDKARAQKAYKDAVITFAEKTGLDGETQNSTKLSGGQIQRIAIARALYAEPSLLVLDEATSGLDQATEQIIRQCLLREKGKRATIISAHRLETLEICDNILWLEQGRLLAYGPPGEILKSYRQELEKQTFNERKSQNLK